MAGHHRITELYKRGFYSKEEYLKFTQDVHHNSSYARSKTIGVIDGNWLMTNLHLKQLSLIFDEVYIINLNNWIDELRKKEYRFEESIVHSDSELDWLLQEKIINEYILPNDKEFEEKEFVKKEYERLVEFYNSKLFQQTTNHYNKESDDYLIKLTKTFHHHSVFIARLASSLINSETRNEAFPIVDNVYDLSEFLVDLPKAHVVNVSITQLPTPSKLTSWEQIRDFRNDPESKEKYIRLKRWISKLAKENLKSNEISDEIESLIHDYENHMKIHRIKTDKSLLKTTVLTTVEIFENLARLKFSEVVKKMFSFENRKISILEAELKAPGREIAYIVKAKQTFSR